MSTTHLVRPDHAVRDAAPPGDNLLGICHALGETFGFDPLFLRVPLIASVLLSFELAIAVYAALGLAVLLARFGARAQFG